MNKYFLAIGAVLYITSGLVIAYWLTEYVFRGLILLLTSGTIIEPDISAEDNFFVDLIVFIFFITSFIATSYFVSRELYPKLKRTDKKDIIKPMNTLEVVKYISTDEENEVLNALTEEEKVYKFEIARKTGLSKMKVHRIVQRLEQRDIVKITPIGRNRQVKISEWIIQ